MRVLDKWRRSRQAAFSTAYCAHYYAVSERFHSLRVMMHGFSFTRSPTWVPPWKGTVKLVNIVLVFCSTIRLLPRPTRLPNTTLTNISSLLMRCYFFFAHITSHRYIISVIFYHAASGCTSAKFFFPNTDLRLPSPLLVLELRIQKRSNLINRKG